MPITASPVGAPSASERRAVARARALASAQRQAAPRHTSARRDSSSVVTVRSASPRMSRQPMRSRWRYLKRRSAFMRASRRGERREARGEVGREARRRATAASCAARAATASASGRRRSVSARNWLVAAEAREQRAAPGMRGEQCGGTTARSTLAARRSRLLSAMSGSAPRRARRAAAAAPARAAPPRAASASARAGSQRRRGIRESQPLELRSAADHPARPRASPSRATRTCGRPGGGQHGCPPTGECGGHVWPRIWRA